RHAGSVNEAGTPVQSRRAPPHRDAAPDPDRPTGAHALAQWTRRDARGGGMASRRYDRHVRVARQHRHDRCGRRVLALSRRDAHDDVDRRRGVTPYRAGDAHRARRTTRHGNVSRRRRDQLQAAGRRGAGFECNGSRRSARARDCNGCIDARRHAGALSRLRGPRRRGRVRVRWKRFCARAGRRPGDGRRSRARRRVSCARARRRECRACRPHRFAGRRMMQRLFARHALLPQGWSEDVVVEIDDGGSIASVMPGGDPSDTERVTGPLLPAMPNVHSHAFKRGLAGRTGRHSHDRSDTFWTWRDVVYDFLDQLDADDLEAVTTQAYVEMVKAGYTTVAEFHYVHHDVDGRPLADPAENAWRVVNAARVAGIGLTLLPVFYAHAGFGGTDPTRRQRRLVHAPHTFYRLYEALEQGRAKHRYVLGIAPHSLRAVTPEELSQVLGFATPDAPIHIH